MALVGVGWCWLVLVGVGWHWLVLVGVGWCSSLAGLVVYLIAHLHPCT